MFSIIEFKMRVRVRVFVLATTLYILRHSQLYIYLYCPLLEIEIFGSFDESARGFGQI